MVAKPAGTAAGAAQPLGVAVALQAAAGPMPEPSICAMAGRCVAAEVGQPPWPPGVPGSARCCGRGGESQRRRLRRRLLRTARKLRGSGNGEARG